MTALLEHADNAPQMTNQLAEAINELTWKRTEWTEEQLYQLMRPWEVWLAKVPLVGVKLAGYRVDNYFQAGNGIVKNRVVITRRGKELAIQTFALKIAQAQEADNAA
jgi:hypothetical protein